MIGRCIVTASMHRCDPIPRGYTVEDELPMGIEGRQQVKGGRRLVVEP
jgi:hypothetical protein